MKCWLIGAAMLMAAVGTPRAQPPQSPMESRAAEVRDGVDTLIAMAKQSNDTAAEANRRLDLVRAAVGGDGPMAAPAPEPEALQPTPHTERARAALIAEPLASAPVKSVWDFSPVAAALIQSLLLAIATLTPLVIGWVAWELRKRTGIAERQSDVAILNTAVKNSIGAMEQSAVELGGKPEPGVATSYVLMHAGEEAERLGVNSTAIAEKVAAQMGLQSLALKAAAAAAPVLHTVLPPTP
jgi:hypothetical protein